MQIYITFTPVWRAQTIKQYQADVAHYLQAVFINNDGKSCTYIFWRDVREKPLCCALHNKWYTQLNTIWSRLHYIWLLQIKILCQIDHHKWHKNYKKCNKLYSHEFELHIQHAKHRLGYVCTFKNMTVFDSIFHTTKTLPKQINCVLIKIFKWCHVLECTYITQTLFAMLYVKLMAVLFLAFF